MKDRTIKIDLSKIANTALQEKVDKELEKVLENILDLNTEAKTTRKITITLTMSTDDERTVVNTGIEVKSTLAPQKGVATTVIVGRDDTGKIHANELKSGIPGQTYFDDNGDMRTTLANSSKRLKNKVQISLITTKRKRVTNYDRKSQRSIILHSRTSG